MLNLWRLVIAVALLSVPASFGARCEDGALPVVTAAFQTQFPSSMSLLTKIKKKKAYRLSCDDLKANAEGICGKLACDSGPDCLEALCSRRWKQCGYKPTCDCQGRD